MNEDDYDDTPLHQYRAFGAGIKRKRIDFVPQSESSGVNSITSNTPKQGAGDLYLSIVLGKKQRGSKKGSSPHTDVNACSITDGQVAAMGVPAPAIEPHQEFFVDGVASKPSPKICPICTGVIAISLSHHEATLHHQLSLPHSHPPSSIDRTSLGLSYLSAYGWDPDARLGLGASNSGRLHPIRATNRADKDKLGVGATQETKLKAVKEKKLDAGEAKKKEEAVKAKAARMRQLVFNSDEVNKHLGLEL